MKYRLDQLLVRRGLVSTRSQAESYIKLGKVTVDGKLIKKPGFFAGENSTVVLKDEERYVSRAGMKLASVARALKLDFKDAIVLDVGSSTGGFTDYSLKRGAKKVFAVDVGTEQLHPTLHDDPRIELHEKTDIRDVVTSEQLTVLSGADYLNTDYRILSTVPDIIVIDVSFISLREILPHIAKYIAGSGTSIVAMVKPQFEAGKAQVNKGIIKNDSVRRQILKEFEVWTKELFVINDKADSEVAGSHGNRERFYLMKKTR